MGTAARAASVQVVAEVTSCRKRLDLGEPERMSNNLPSAAACAADSDEDLPLAGRDHQPPLREDGQPR